MAGRSPYTRELVASVGRQYRNPDKSLNAIAAEHEISLRTVRRLAEREGWVRPEPVLRGLARPMRLQAAAQALEGAQGPGGAAVAPEHAAAAGAVADTPAAAGAELPASAETPAPGLTAIERMERLLEQEIAAEEAVRAELGAKRPRMPGAARTAARNLRSLTETVDALQRARLRAAPPAQDAQERDYDDGGEREYNDGGNGRFDELRAEILRRLDRAVEEQQAQLAQADAGTAKASYMGPWDSGTVRPFK
jgi:hypothetical protein